MFPLLLCCLGLLAHPSSSQGHGSEFIVARLAVQAPDRAVSLRLAVDYLSNPLVPDEAAAEKALRNALLVLHDGKATPFAQLAPLKLEAVDGWDDTIPASLIPPPDGEQHRMLVASWQWRPDSPEIAFGVARGNRNDVLLWRLTDRGEAKSVFLLGGDTSPPLSIPRPASLWTPPAWVVLPTTAALSVLGMLAIRKRRCCQGGLG
ncbi:MAG: hypothetical protein CJBNEKGG_02200 [Prosthecobacter sp.]|nr:hypothetical protein [Prosthecobacter sp.]